MGKQLVLVPPPDEIRSAIEQLHQPLDGSRVQWILDSIAQQSQLQDAETLQQALETRMQELTAETASSERGLVMPVDSQTLRLEIETLHLGPEATVEELRRRDELVGEIAQISDPNLRHELLQLLEERERSADNVATETVNR